MSDGWRPDEVRRLTLADFWLVVAARAMRGRAESGKLGTAGDDRRTWGRLMQAAGLGEARQGEGSN